MDSVNTIGEQRQRDRPARPSDNPFGGSAKEAEAAVPEDLRRLAAMTTSARKLLWIAAVPLFAFGLCVALERPLYGAPVVAIGIALVVIARSKPKAHRLPAIRLLVEHPHVVDRLIITDQTAGITGITLTQGEYGYLAVLQIEDHADFPEAMTILQRYVPDAPAEFATERHVEGSRRGRG